MSTSLLGMVPRTRLRAETHHDLVSQLLVTAGIEAVRPRESARGESTGSEVRNPVRYPFLPSERLHRGMFLAHVANVPAKRRSNRDLVVTLGTRTRCRLSARKADSSTPRGTTGIRAFEQSRWEGLGGVCSVERRRSTDPRTGNGEEPESSSPFSLSLCASTRSPASAVAPAPGVSASPSRGYAGACTSSSIMMSVSSSWRSVA